MERTRVSKCRCYQGAKGGRLVNIMVLIHFPPPKQGRKSLENASCPQIQSPGEHAAALPLCPSRRRSREEEVVQREILSLGKTPGPNHPQNQCVHKYSLSRARRTRLQVDLASWSLFFRLYSYSR